MKLISFNRKHVPENSNVEKLLTEYGYSVFPVEVKETGDNDYLGFPIVIGENKTNTVSSFYFITKKS